MDLPLAAAILHHRTVPPRSAHSGRQGTRWPRGASTTQRYAHIVVDSPPILSVSDAKVWANVADAAVLVARNEWTCKTDLQEASDRLRRSGSEVIGAVLTGADVRDRYTYRRSYYAADRGNGASGNGKRTHRRDRYVGLLLPERVEDGNGHAG